MTTATVVRYTTRPEAADENERLIRAVFAQLADESPTVSATPRSDSRMASASCTLPSSTGTTILCPS